MKTNKTKECSIDRAESKLATREQAMKRRSGKLEVLPVKSRVKAGATNIYGVAE